MISFLVFLVLQHPSLLAFGKAYFERFWIVSQLLKGNVVTETYALPANMSS